MANDYYSTIRRKQQILKSRGLRITERAASMCWNHGKYLDALKLQIWDSSLIKGLPRWSVAEIRGWLAAVQSLLIDANLAWHVYHPRLGLIPSSQVPDGDWSLLIDAGAHVWKHSPKNRWYPIAPPANLDELIAESLAKAGPSKDDWKITPVSPGVPMIPLACVGCLKLDGFVETSNKPTEHAYKCSVYPAGIAAGLEICSFKAMKGDKAIVQLAIGL